MSDLHDSQSLRRRVIAWFVLVIGLVAAAAGIGWWRVYEAMHSRATSEAQRAVDLVRTQLESADTVYASMTRACVSVLEAEALALGAPSLGAQVTLTNRSVPELRFGNEVINERYELVDKVVARLGGLAPEALRQAVAAEAPPPRPRHRLADLPGLVAKNLAYHGANAAERLAKALRRLV